MRGRLSPEVEAERLRRYHAGENDAAIAAAEGCSRTTITMWRGSRRLASAVVREREAARARFAEWLRRRRIEEAMRPVPPPAPPAPPRVWFDARKLKPAADQRRRELHALGWSDSRIAKDQGVDRASIGQWRRGHNLAANSPAPTKRAHDLEQRRRLILMGLSDCEVAAKQGCGRTSVRQYRERHGLPRNYENAEERKARGEGRQYLPSLDAPLRGHEDLSLYGVVADSSWSSWLEEMGATVW